MIRVRAVRPRVAQCWGSQGDRAVGTSFVLRVGGGMGGDYVPRELFAASSLKFIVERICKHSTVSSWFGDGLFSF